MLFKRKDALPQEHIDAHNAERERARQMADELDAEAQRWREAGRVDIKLYRDRVLKDPSLVCAGQLEEAARFHEECATIADCIEDEAGGLRYGIIHPDEAREYHLIAKRAE